MFFNGEDMDGIGVDVHINKVHVGDLTNIRQSDDTFSSRDPTAGEIFKGFRISFKMICDEKWAHCLKDLY